MEPHDLDNTFRKKIIEGGEAQYANEAGESKERVWNRVSPVSGGKPVNWRRYAAAIVLLFAASVLFVGTILHKKNSEIRALTVKMSQLNKNLEYQKQIIYNQKIKLTELNQNLQNKKTSSASAIQKNNNRPVVVREIKYVFDTVFIETTPEITETPVKPMEKMTGVQKNAVDQQSRIVKIMIEDTPRKNDQVRFILPEQKSGDRIKTSKEQTKLRWGNSSDENAPAQPLTFKIKL